MKICTLSRALFFHIYLFYNTLWRDVIYSTVTYVKRMYPLECKHYYSQMWPIFLPTLAMIKLDQDIVKTNILSKFE